jgi:DNA-binding NtrC family response regulator
MVLPPLLERREDIPELAEHFLTSRQLGSVRYRLSPESSRALLNYDWPGNVRELANVLERAQILAEEYTITLDDLPEGIVASADTTLAPRGDPRLLREVERRHILEVLRQEKGNKVHAAKALGVSRRALYRLISKHGLDGISQ